jgi:hypothetical protein
MCAAYTLLPRQDADNMADNSGMGTNPKSSGRSIIRERGKPGNSQSRGTPEYNSKGYRLQQHVIN